MAIEKEGRISVTNNTRENMTKNDLSTAENTNVMMKLHEKRCR
jgi:hypothetical protein